MGGRSSRSQERDFMGEETEERTGNEEEKQNVKAAKKRYSVFHANR